MSTVTFALLFTSSNHPAPDPALCPESGSQATTGSIPFQEAVIVQDMESGQYYLQVLPAFCWMEDGVSIPYRLAINTELQPPENVSAHVAWRNGRIREWKKGETDMQAGSRSGRAHV